MNLLYLSYGSGVHEQEVKFSVLSALHWSPRETEFQIHVYTDHPESFADIPVRIQYISPDQWKEWSGPRQFNHRRKIVAIKHFFEHHEGAVVLLDGDTWLRAPVERLFGRLAPGSTLMHIREGKVSRIDTPVFRALRDLLDTSQFADAQGKTFCISSDVDMYNAGAVGLDLKDAGLLDEVLDLTDQLGELSDLHVIEQFAFTFVLGMRTKLQESDDLVFHYWPPYLHEPFRRDLPSFMAKSEAMSTQQRADFLFAHRPRPSWPRRGKVIAKRALQMTGIFRGGCRSNEW